MQTLIDYLSFSDCADRLDYWLEFFHLPLTDFQTGRPRYGWSEHQFFSGIHVYTGTRSDVFFEFSGVGCRTLETIHHNQFNWLHLLSLLASYDFSSACHVTRLDVACDDTDGVLCFPELYLFTQQRKYITKARRVFWTDGSEQEIMFGSPKSDTRLRIYNKALERGVPDEHWIRSEFQLRNDAAFSFLQNLKNTRNIGSCYSGVLLNYLRYIEDWTDANNNNSRIPTAPWWANFLGECERLKNIYVGGLEYNRQSLIDYIRKQCSSSLKAYVELFDGDFSELFNIIDDAKLNPKQIELLRREKLKEGSAAYGKYNET